jgi:uncharacterized protein (UPF0248 family)
MVIFLKFNPLLSQRFKWPLGRISVLWDEKDLGKRRSIIRQEINRIRYSKNPDNYVIIYIDRDVYGNQRLASLEVSQIKGVTEWAIFLKDGETVIPLHRVIEIRDKEGRLVWRRGASRG